MQSAEDCAQVLEANDALDSDSGVFYIVPRCLKGAKHWDNL